MKLHIFSEPENSGNIQDATVVRPMWQAWRTAASERAMRMEMGQLILVAKRSQLSPLQLDSTLSRQALALPLTVMRS
jgi:hypothetical protein